MRYFPIVNRWIGRLVIIEWPVRPPEQTPLNFLRDALKSEVFLQRPNNIEELKEDYETLHNIMHEFDHHLAYYQKINGSHFEQFI